MIPSLLGSRVSGRSSSPIQLRRTFLYSPCMRSASCGSSGDRPWPLLSPLLLLLPLDHLPSSHSSLRTKKTRSSGMSKSCAVHAPRAGENMTRSLLARMVISPRKQRGSETETSPELAHISMSRFGHAPFLPSEPCCFCVCISNPSTPCSLERGGKDVPLLPSQNQTGSRWSRPLASICLSRRG
jgi:hypothetical protein